MLLHLGEEEWDERRDAEEDAVELLALELER